MSNNSPRADISSSANIEQPGDLLHMIAITANEPQEVMASIPSGIQVIDIREGCRVRVKRNQGYLSQDRFPGRIGVVQSRSDPAGEYWHVRLASTPRARERTEFFCVKVLENMTLPSELSDLPPISGAEFATTLSSAENLVFAGTTYSLVQHSVPGQRDGWAVNAIYPGGLKRTLGIQVPLTRSLAVEVAARDAMDWWLNRRLQQAHGT